MTEEAGKKRSAWHLDWNREADGGTVIGDAGGGKVNGEAM